MKFWTLLALLFCGALLFADITDAKAKDAGGDSADGEDDDGKVEEEDAKQTPDAVSKTEKDEEEEVETLKPSPDAETYILFTKPVNKQELPAGGIVKFLVGFHNKGSQDFLVDTVDTTFRYPMDFTYYIQNYSAAHYSRIVKPGEEASFDYAFVPSEQYAGRPMGVVVSINYRGAPNNTLFQNAVFNETIQIVEEDAGFNPETGFLYVFLACIAILLLLVGQQFLQKMRKKHGLSKRTHHQQPVEMGTTKGNADVDMDWIPKEVLNHMQKSPRPGSPKDNQKSPRQRKNRAQVGADE